MNIRTEQITEALKMELSTLGCPLDTYVNYEGAELTCFYEGEQRIGYVVLESIPDEYAEWAKRFVSRYEDGPVDEFERKIRGITDFIETVTGPVFYLRHFDVAPAFQGKGYGRKMFRHQLQYLNLIFYICLETQGFWDRMCAKEVDEYFYAYTPAIRTIWVKEEDDGTFDVGVWDENADERDNAMEVSRLASFDAAMDAMRGVVQAYPCVPFKQMPLQGVTGDVVFTVNQIAVSGRESLLKFCDLPENVFSVDLVKEKYERRYTGKVNGDSDRKILHALCERFNIQRPHDFKGHSMSVSDIVSLNGQYYYVTCDGFRPITVYGAA